MSELIIDDLRDGYRELVEWVFTCGRDVAPRGQRTQEILNATVTLTDPTQALPVGIGRKPNLAIGAGEAIQLVGGFTDPEMMVSIAKSFERFLDGGVLAGAYGPRIRNQLPVVVDRLRADTDSRQAVAEVSRPDDFAGVPTRDVPCTKDFHFFIRGGALEMIASMRSNDVWLGVAYDFFQFTQLQLSVAKALGIPCGPYHHHADSLHIYERDLEAAGELHEYDGTPIPDVQGIGNGPSSIEEMQVRAVELWTEDGESPHWTASELWYVEQLRGHTRPQRSTMRRMEQLLP